MQNTAGPSKNKTVVKCRVIAEKVFTVKECTGGIT